MNLSNEYRAYFSFSGDFDPSELSARIGLEPTRFWTKGDTNPKTQLERKHSRWIVDSRLPKHSSLEAHVQDVIDQLRPRSREVRNERERTDGGLQLVGYFHNAYPGFGLEEDMIAAMASMNLGFDCDFYYLYSNEREDSE